MTLANRNTIPTTPPQEVGTLAHKRLTADMIVNPQFPLQYQPLRLAHCSFILCIPEYSIFLVKSIRNHLGGWLSTASGTWWAEIYMNSVSDVFCNWTWDSVLCWPPTRAATTASQKCPKDRGIDPTSKSKSLVCVLKILIFPGLYNAPQIISAVLRIRGKGSFTTWTAEFSMNFPFHLIKPLVAWFHFNAFERF